MKFSEIYEGSDVSDESDRFVPIKDFALMAVTKGARGKRKHAKPNGKRRKAAAHKRKQGVRSAT